MNQLRGKKVTIIGAAKSGIAAARLVRRLSGQAKVSEYGPWESIGEEDKQWIREQHVPVETGGHTRAFVEDSDFVVISPGVRVDAPPVLWAREKKIPLIGEIEFASRYCATPIIAVTGTNGKTTVSTLIHQVLLKAGKKASLCGNIGTPFAETVSQLNGRHDFVVLEISSFQLETIEKFKPHVALLLNFYQNHLDRHKDMLEYFEAKTRIFENQDRSDFAVLNYDNECLRDLAPRLRAKVSYFNSVDKIANSEWKNPNHLAVLEVASVLNIRKEICVQVFSSFPGVEHRMEFVRTLKGVDYVNDSKATTAESGRWALERIDKPVVLICGGKDKQIDYTDLSPIVARKVKCMVVIGETKEKLKKTFSRVVEVIECGDLKEAIDSAGAKASQGDCVLFSPMCSSFDMFKSFEHRGMVFKSLVGEL